MLLKHLPKLLPVCDRNIAFRAEMNLKELMNVPNSLPLSIPKPWRWNADQNVTETNVTPVSIADVTTKNESALLAWLPGNLTLLVGQNGSLFHSFFLPKPRLCVNDSTDGAVPCSLYRGTVVGVDVNEDGAWAYDVFAVRGECIIHENFFWRRQRLDSIKTCVPDLQLSSMNPKNTQSRIWDSHGCIWQRRE